MREKEALRYQVILWDVDGTLLDFIAAEKAAIRSLFAEFGLGECSDEMTQTYSAINRKYWERLERGEITKPEVLLGRFFEFFQEIGVDTAIAEEFNSRYQLSLGDTIVYCDDSRQIIESLKGKVRQCVVTNGTKIAQDKKLKVSGFGELMDDIFISEVIGIEKPNAAYFDVIFSAIGDVPREQILIVGDSLTSDIRGGNNAEIDTCWYNPRHLENDKGVSVNYEITDLHEIYRVIGMV